MPVVFLLLLHPSGHILPCFQRLKRERCQFSIVPALKTYVIPLPSLLFWHHPPSTEKKNPLYVKSQWRMTQLLSLTSQELLTYLLPPNGPAVEIFANLTGLVSSIVRFDLFLPSDRSSSAATLTYTLTINVLNSCGQSVPTVRTITVAPSTVQSFSFSTANVVSATLSVSPSLPLPVTTLFVGATAGVTTSYLVSPPCNYLATAMDGSNISNSYQVSLNGGSTTIYDSLCVWNAIMLVSFSVNNPPNPSGGLTPTITYTVTFVRRGNNRCPIVRSYVVTGTGFVSDTVAVRGVQTITVAASTTGVVPAGLVSPTFLLASLGTISYAPTRC